MELVDQGLFLGGSALVLEVAPDPDFIAGSRLALGNISDVCQLLPVVQQAKWWLLNYSSLKYLP
jgi:hypothetical protein